MRFLQNLAWERESQVRILVPNFIVVGLQPPKSRQTKNITLFRLQPARDSGFPPGDRRGPSHFCTFLTFFDPISSFAARGYWKFEGKCTHRGKYL